MAIITDRLLGYWHYQKNCNITEWKNISPNGDAAPIGIMNNIAFNNGAPYFNGTNSSVDFTGVPIINPSSMTIETIFRRETTHNSQSMNFCLFYNNTDRLTIDSVGPLMGNDESISVFFEKSGWGRLEKEKLSLGTNLIHITLIYEQNIKKLYLNGQLIASSTTKSSMFNRPNYNLFLGCNYYNGNKTYFHKGHLYLCRLYIKSLTDAEITQNYNEGLNIGLSEPSKPIPNIISLSKQRISKVSGMDKSIITFNFDKDIQAYRVVVGGVDYSTGFLADSGGAKAAGVNITGEIDWTELPGEGQSRINVYGQSIDGIWSDFG